MKLAMTPKQWVMLTMIQVHKTHGELLWRSEFRQNFNEILDYALNICSVLTIFPLGTSIISLPDNFQKKKKKKSMSAAIGIFRDCYIFIVI